MVLFICREVDECVEKLKAVYIATDLQCKTCLLVYNMFTPQMCYKSKGYNYSFTFPASYTCSHLHFLAFVERYTQLCHCITEQIHGLIHT